MMHLVKNLALAAGLALSMACAQAQTLAGYVIHVSDGDTATVITGKHHEKIRVRLAGIDAPESKQDFGRRSQLLLSRLVKGRDVLVHVVDRDKYGRHVAWIETEDGDAGEKMLEAGLAWANIRFLGNLPREMQVLYRHMEGVARTQKRGLWSAPNQIPPWEWRQMRRDSYLQ